MDGSNANNAIKEVALRIRDLREILEISEETAAIATDVTVDQYRAYERGELDYSFTFIYKCAKLFGVDVTDILKGSSPKLSEYSVTKAGGGLPIVRRKGFSYNNLAPLFRNKISEPFYVVAKYSEAEQNEPIHLSTHKGQEFDYIIKGTLKAQLGEHIEFVSAGDSIYYDSSMQHGMIAYGGEDCEFIAVVMNAEGLAYEYPEADKIDTSKDVKIPAKHATVADEFIDVELNENGTPVKINFKNTERYNFAYDTVERLA